MRLAPTAVVLLALLAGGGPAWASGQIRVAILENARVVELRGDVKVTPLDACRCLPSRRMARVRAVATGRIIEIDGWRSPAFRLESTEPIRLKGRLYGPVLEIVRAGEGIAVVNELPLEDYVVGVVKAESGDRWPPETLRAQAIVARTYAAYHRLLGAGKPWHLVASTAHQQYFGRVPPSSPAWSAARDTAGQVLLWEGDLFPAFYHTESGGHTEDPREVYAATNMPALKAVRCEFSAGSPHYAWVLDLRLADVGDALRRHGYEIGTVKAIEVTERTRSRRAASVTVRGTRATVALRGNDFRRIVGYDTLKSTLFTVSVHAGHARFSGRGYGHGVGMCQWGAKGMAEQGYAAPRILEFYYPGTTLSTLEALGR